MAKTRRNIDKRKKEVGVVVSCPYCGNTKTQLGKSFADPDVLYRHMRQAHGKEIKEQQRELEYPLEELKKMEEMFSYSLKNR